MSTKLLAFTICLFCINFSTAQVEYLRLSPAQTITQRVGATDLNIAFSRPQMKGRKIFGGLTPYGKLWRTGANENTTIEFSHQVKVGETEVQPGKYALFTEPNPNQWKIYLYTDTDNLDVPNPIDTTKLIYLTTVPVRKLNFPEETLVINIYDITETTANLGISWEHSSVRIPISFYTREAMEEQITKAFKQNMMDYSIAASYYQQRDIELQKAKELKELVMELKGKPSVWDYNSYGIILFKLGEKSEAIKNLEISLKLAQEQNNNYLIEENKKMLKLARQE